EHDAVADAYVYGLPDEFFGEIVAAAVRLKADATSVSAEELTAWCASALAKFKVPKHMRFVSGFPMTASGKIQKYKLRQEHEQVLKEQKKCLGKSPGGFFSRFQPRRSTPSGCHQKGRS